MSAESLHVLIDGLQSPGLPGAYNGINAIERAHKDFLDGTVNEMGIMMQVSIAFLSGTHALLITSTRHYVISEVDMYVSTQRIKAEVLWLNLSIGENPYS